jgi:site-specific recombinase XerC
MAMPKPTFDRYLTRQEEKQLFRTLRAQQDKLAQRDLNVMLLMRHTGGRVGSILALTVEDAQTALRTKSLHFRKAKGGHTYSVLCTLQARTALKALLRIRRSMGHPPEPEARLIMGMKGKGLAVRSFELRVQIWGKRAGLSIAVTPHFFRHTLAKRIVETSESKDPLGVVQAVLGQKSRDTATIYARPGREDIARDLELAR